jgi:hypothetical protein
MLKNIKSGWIVIVFFAIFLMTGIFIYRDYGVPFDEKAQILIGDANFQYVSNENQNLLNIQDRYYGPFFEMPLSVLTKNMPSSDIIYYRYLAVFLTFFAGSIFLYFLARRLFKKNWWALLSTVLLVISPRLFADSFYNSKDIPFMTFFVMGSWSLVEVLGQLINKPSGRKIWGLVGLHALICAATTATRIAGITLIGLSIVLILVEAFKYPTNWKQNLFLLAGYLILTIGFILLFWPILWHSPIGEFFNAFILMSRYPWPGSTLYLGKFIQAKDSVWHYLPVWISISAPYLQLGGFVLGCFCLLTAVSKRLIVLFKNKLRSWNDIITFNNLAWMVVAGWLVIPIITILAFHSILYDAWRQMFFIYPAIVLIGVYGLKTSYEWLLGSLRKKSSAKLAFGIILALGILEPVLFMVQNHPHENVYFNALSGDPATLRQRFEMDYWGLSNKQAIDYILAHDPRKEIKISAAIPGKLYVEYMLPKSQASRFVFVDTKQADYFLTTYRFHPYDFQYPDRYFSIKVRGIEIMTAYLVNKAK